MALLCRTRITNMLITAYITILWPVFEYACQVLHFNIQEYLSEDIEQIQRRASRILLPLMSYSEAWDFTGIPSEKHYANNFLKRMWIVINLAKYCTLKQQQTTVWYVSNVTKIQVQ